MKSKLYKTIFPPITGIFFVLFILLIVDLFLFGPKILEGLWDNSSILFYQIILIPAIIISTRAQFFLTLPLWDRFKTKKKIFGMTLIPFTTVLCFVSGVLFGLTFWERIFGIKEFLLTSLVGIIAFIIYWTINLHTVNLIDKQNKNLKKYAA